MGTGGGFSFNGAGSDSNLSPSTTEIQFALGLLLHITMNFLKETTNWLALFLLGVAILFYFYKTNQRPRYFAPNMAGETPKSVYNFTVKDIHGSDVSLSQYTGKVVLILNVASQCGFTQSNYKELNVLYEKYKDQGFEILAFPCNQFGRQEPGSNEEIKDTVCTMFKAEFPIFGKIDVNGKNAAPIYQYLKSQKGGYFGDSIKWNFTKFLVDKEGKVVERYSPTTSPFQIEKDIQNLLESK